MSHSMFHFLAPDHYKGHIHNQTQLRDRDNFRYATRAVTHFGMAHLIVNSALYAAIVLWKP